MQFNKLQEDSVTSNAGHSFLPYCEITTALAVVFYSYWVVTAGLVHAFRFWFTYLGVLWTDLAWQVSLRLLLLACLLPLFLLWFSSKQDKAVSPGLVGTICRFCSRFSSLHNYIHFKIRRKNFNIIRFYNESSSVSVYSTNDYKIPFKYPLMKEVALNIKIHLARLLGYPWRVLINHIRSPLNWFWLSVIFLE